MHFFREKTFLNMSSSEKVQTSRKVQYIGPRSRRLNEISGLDVDGRVEPH